MLGACLIYAINIATVFECRQVLDEFLQGNCRKQKYKSIKHSLSFKEKLFLSYIRQYIKTESELKSFQSYHRFYLFEMVFVHLKFACVVILMMTPKCNDKAVIIAYLLVQLFNLYFVSRDRCWPHHYTTHIGLKRKSRREDSR